MARDRHKKPEPARSPSFTAWLNSLVYRAKDEPHVVFPVGCGGAALLWLLVGCPVFGFLAAGVGWPLDLIDTHLARTVAVGLFAFPVSMVVVAGTCALAGQADAEITWKQETTSLLLALVATAIFGLAAQ